jgi:ketosteroid isomerase-like protein
MDLTQEVLEAARARAVALASGDAKRFLELLHERFRWTTHTGERYDRGEYIQRNTGGLTVWRSQELSNALVTVVGDAAVLHADVIDQVVAAGAAVETFRMPMTQMWVRSTSGWNSVAGHAGPQRL